MTQKAESNKGDISYKLYGGLTNTLIRHRTGVIQIWEETDSFHYVASSGQR